MSTRAKISPAIELSAGQLPVNAMIQQYLHGESSARLLLQQYLTSKDEGHTTQHSVRQLEASLLFTDIAGSSSIFEKYGDEYGRAIVALHDDVVERVMRSSNGKIVKFTGDGALCSFQTCNQAVEASLKINREIQQHNVEYPLLNLDICMGINVGKVLMEDDDFYGSSVNLAARVCDLAGSNKIFVTGIVVIRCKKSQVNCEFISHGKYKMKGFEHQIPIFEINQGQGKQPL